MSHWRLDYQGDHAVLTLDVQGQSANVLSQEVLNEFDKHLEELETKMLAGVILCSGKASGFIAGADVREFEKIDDPAQATELAQLGQQVFSRLESLPYPSVAVIHGFCLGGGLELALACTYRIARDDPGTRLGLPEVRLGIHPGFAGTVRLPPLVGDLTALDMMLTGRALSAREARRRGLVDELVPERHLMNAAVAFLKQNPPPRKAPWYQRVPAWKPLRSWVVKLMAGRVRRKAHPDHYPAPWRILDLWRDQAREDREAESLGELLVGRTSRNLVHVFLLGEALKRHGKAQAHDIEHVHVIGAGVMGADIAIWAANKGFRVSLQDREPEILARAVKKAHGFFKSKLKDPRAVQEAMDRFMPDLEGHGLKRADLVIEAIVEKIGPKQELFRAVEQKVRPQALLATNTSSIPLEVIGEALKDPSRLVGLHFFNPVAKMQLVEIVRGAQTSEAALGRARAFTGAIERLPLDVKSSPGFLVNRILMPYLLEAVKMAEEGVSLVTIDNAATEFGMPMGPITLADTVGLDICLSVAEELAGPLRIDVPERLRELVGQGHLGRKSGQGFYQYDARGKRQTPPPEKIAADVPVTERLVLRLLNEAVACLREGVVVEPDAVDAGMVYGTGFAPFLGGPMRYVESLGVTGISHSLHRLSQEYGPRFNPDAGWSNPDLLKPGSA
ncbi:MAG: 3-hydroxyacyl-CoA dehydrogenase NAD-binding domain-containing protein [Sulfuricaulis sp.]|uniref:3-hydroxyacyl-CoA dehydrogenase NAD-binding domain-containing protein n=1 Tax=Sulfuricaulis sp. TaxID=2003553 RepID=UPI0025EA7B2B|nr:3-hydroxyacyl-CoA dehydrogenase NAD-binding domain-containing protein [Sulfuricaulis sp.]MCR4347843.1 3-hydroxyacyl-CoA dehydrogenase NAD-binding domain-containing protein [Sulfuricaulis sp.]